MVVGDINISPYITAEASCRQSRGGASGRLMAIKGSAFTMNKDSRQNTPDKIVNVKIHKSETSQQAVETKENTKDISKDEKQTRSNDATNRDNKIAVDPQAWIID